MALTGHKEYSQLVERSMGSVRMKMDGIKAEIHAAEQRKQRAMAATDEQLKRGRQASDCKRALYELIQQKESLTEKVEMKLGYCKERMQLADWRLRENGSMTRYLRRDDIDFRSVETKIASYEERAEEMVGKIAAANRRIVAKEKEIELAERREYKARDKAALLNEKVVAAEHESRRVTINYTPRTTAELQKQILFLKQERDDTVDRMNRWERKGKDLERRAAELTQTIETMKNRTKQLAQTLHELRGAKV